jgi:acyl-CoA synthetase (AMP-forming)/AMP-acid ligase II
VNAAQLFRDAARAHPERIAFFEDLRTTTFAQLWHRVARFSGALHRRGFGPGDRALIFLPMSVDLYVALLAVLKEGGVAVFLDPWVGWRRLIALARHAQPKAFLGTPKSHVLRLFVRGIDIAPWTLDERAAPRETMFDAQDDDPALITFTTGSSGTPKHVNRPHRVLAAQHERLAESFPYEDGDVDLCTFPIFALNNLACGVPTIIPPIDLRRVDAADPKRVADVAIRCDATTATASPPLFDKLAHMSPRPTLRRILTGGAPVTDAQLRGWIAAWPDAEIIVAYGSSEAEPVAHIEARERLAARGLGYLAGQIANGVRTKLELIDERVGELLVSGEHVAESDKLITDADGTRWHRMGDTGWFDEERRFWIAGRVHSTIWRDGVALHAQFIEQAAIGDDPRIRRAGAVGVNNQLVVMVESDHDVLEDVRRRVPEADHVGVTKTPLPVDPRHNSKIDYEALRDWFQ